MAFCANCGAQLEDDAKFCATCGWKAAEEVPAAPAPEYQAAPAPEYQAPSQQPAGFASTVQNFNNTADTTGEYDPAEIQGGKGMSVLAYLGILCLIPLFAAKANRFVQFHVRQGFTLFVAGVALEIINLLAGLIFRAKETYWYWTYYVHTWPYYIFAFICWIGFILIAVLSIIGIVNACKGKAKELPITGKIDLLKIFKK